MCISVLNNYSSSAINTVKSYLPSAQTAAKIGIGVAVAGLTGYWLSSQSISYAPSEPTACMPHSFLGIDTPLMECFPIRNLQHLSPLANSVSNASQSALHTANETATVIADQARSVLESIANATASVSQNVMQLANETSSQIAQQAQNISTAIYQNVSSALENATVLTNTSVSSDAEQPSSIATTVFNTTAALLLGLIPCALARGCKKAKPAQDPNSAQNPPPVKTRERKKKKKQDNKNLFSRGLTVVNPKTNSNYSRKTNSRSLSSSVTRHSASAEKCTPILQQQLVASAALEKAAISRSSPLAPPSKSALSHDKFPISIPKEFSDLINPAPLLNDEKNGPDKALAVRQNSSLVEIQDGSDSENDQKVSSSTALTIPGQQLDFKISSEQEPQVIEVSTPGAKKATDAQVTKEKRAKINQIVLKTLPFSGVGLGMITATVGRLLHGSGDTVLSVLGEKSKDLCRQGFPGSSLLQTVNGFKQWEIKKLAILTPILPSLVGAVARIASPKDNETFVERVKNGFKENFSKTQVVSLTTFAALGLTNSLYAHALGLSSGTFDASGHVMLKTVLAHVLSETLQTVANKGRKAAGRGAAFTALYALTDAVLMHQTARICHSTAEIAAGLGWGLSIVGISKLAQRVANGFDPQIDFDTDDLFS